MKKLCFASYAKILVACKAVGVTQTTLIAKVITSFCGAQKAWNIEDSPTISDIINGKKNLPSYAPIEARCCNHSDVIAFFSNNIIRLLDDSKLDNLVLCLKDIIRNDDNISERTIVDPVAKKTKIVLLNEGVEDLAEFLVGLLLYTAKNTDKKGSAETIGSITTEYVNSFNGQYGLSLDESRQEGRGADDWYEKNNDDETNEKASNFCIEYEEELHLLPLCEIAAEVHPEHKHVRPIFTAFIRLNKKTQKAILNRKSIIPFKFNNRNWIDESVKCFEKEIIENGLTSVNFLFEDAKYFHRAFDYHAAYRPENMDPFIFKRKYVSGGLKSTPGNLKGIIDDFLFGKNSHPNDDNMPPFDVIWYGLDLANIEEKQLSFWVCRFIVDVCHCIYGFDPVKESGENRKNKDCIEYEKLGTLEDLYYYALFLLYQSYSDEKDETI